MRIWKTENEEIVIEGIPAQLVELIRVIPKVAESGEEHASGRFFPPPSDDPSLKDFCEDWACYVRPELNGHFRRTREELADDLRMIEESDGELKILIPMKHAEGWLSALNQARLSLYEVWRFTEEEMLNGLLDGSREESAELTSRSLARIQCEFYAILMEAILEFVE